MSEPEGLRMANEKDHQILDDTIARLTIAMSEAVPAGTVDGGTLSTALVEIASHVVAAMFPPRERGAQVEHLQNYLMQSVDRWAQHHELQARRKNRG